MRIKLKELFNTQYLYKTFVIDLDYLFNSISALRRDASLTVHPVSKEVENIFNAAKSGAPIEFDLAGCKLTPDCVSCIMSGMHKGIDFCDSADPSRDAILLENKRRIGTNTESFIDLPDFVLGSMIKDYVASLDNTKTYKIPLKDRQIYFPLAFIVQCCRPKVNIAPGGLTNDYLKFIGSNFTIKDLQPYDKFYYITKEGVRTVQLNAERQLYDQKMGLVSIPDALNMGVLVPAIFGVENTLKTSGFDLVFERCLNSLQAQGVSQKLTLEQFFG